MTSAQMADVRALIRIGLRQFGMKAADVDDHSHVKGKPGQIAFRDGGISIACACRKKGVSAKPHRILEQVLYRDVSAEYARDVVLFIENSKKATAWHNAHASLELGEDLWSTEIVNLTLRGNSPFLAQPAGPARLLRLAITKDDVKPFAARLASAIVNEDRVVPRGLAGYIEWKIEAHMRSYRQAYCDQFVSWLESLDKVATVSCDVGEKSYRIHSKYLDDESKGKPKASVDKYVALALLTDGFRSAVEHFNRNQIEILKGVVTELKDQRVKTV